MWLTELQLCDRPERKLQSSQFGGGDALTLNKLAPATSRNPVYFLTIAFHREDNWRRTLSRFGSICFWGLGVGRILRDHNSVYYDCSLLFATRMNTGPH